MAVAYQCPGVYREEKFLKPEAALPTGVAGFIGFANAKQDDRKKPMVDPATPIALHHQEDFNLYFDNKSDSYLADAITGFFLNGGARCYVAYAASKEMKPLKDAVESLAPLQDLDVLAVPDLPDEPLVFQQWLLGHCEGLGDRFAILDIPIDVKKLSGYPKELTANQVTAGAYGALYYPWLTVKAKDGKDRVVPPCGHVAGIFARSDFKTGVFKAPANEEIMGIFDLKDNLSDNGQGDLNSAGINCIRAFPGRGIRVWGARTLSIDEQWRYINVRRLFITVRRWIDLKMGWAVFEPNTPGLRIRIERELDTYFHGLWLRGALKGDSPEQAFFVKCDAETNSADNRDGSVVTEIGLAPIVPAEFVVLRIVHRQPVIADAGSIV